MTPEPSGHCLLSSQEPLSDGINPFLTPSWGWWYPREGDSVWGCQQATACLQQPCNRHAGGAGVPGARDRRHWQRFLLVSSAAPGGAPCPSPQLPRRRNTNYHPNQVRNIPFCCPAQYFLCPVSPPNLMSTLCQLHKQCQEGTGVTKPVGVCGVAKTQPIILQALAPPHQNTHCPREQRVPILVYLTPHFPICLPLTLDKRSPPLGISWGKEK